MRIINVFEVATIANVNGHIKRGYEGVVVTYYLSP